MPLNSQHEKSEHSCNLSASWGFSLSVYQAATLSQVWWVLVLGMKTSSFKIIFSLLMHLTFSFPVLRQTNSPWKVAKMGPRSLSPVTVFSARRVGTWSVFAHFLCLCVLSVMLDSATPWIVTHHVPLSMGFPRQEHWSGLPFPHFFLFFHYHS